MRKMYSVLFLFLICALCFIYNLSNNGITWSYIATVPWLKKRKTLTKTTAFTLEDLNKVSNYVDTTGCVIPNLSNSAPREYKTLREPICDMNLEQLTTLHNGLLTIDNDILNRYFPNKTIKYCGYIAFDRIHSTLTEYKDWLTWGKYTTFKNSTLVNDEFIKVECYDNNDLVVYRNVHAQVKAVNVVLDRNESDVEDLNVLMIGCDSVSRLSFLRHAPELDAYIRRLGGVSLYGYNKVGDNTKPNIIPLLTGLYHDHLQSLLLEYLTGGAYHDNLPFIWKLFQAKGYATFHMDYTEIQFLEKPTHHYMKPFERVLQTENLIPPISPPKHNKKTWAESCAGQRFIRRKTRLLYGFLARYRHKKFFAYAYYDVLTHDNENGMSLMKKYLLDIVHKMEDKNLLNNTLLILFSDHGSRLSSSVFTDSGFYEARLPFVYILLPTWFQEKYRDQYANLKVNSNRLTSNFDVHQTLLDVVHHNIGALSMKSNKFTGLKGQSLFKLISPNRTCTDAGIPRHWCACTTLIHLPNNDKRVKESAISLVNHINDELKKKVPGKCVVYQLDRILNAKTTAITGLAKLNAMKTLYLSNSILVTVQVKPNHAVFRGTVKLYPHKAATDSQIERLNRYGNQSHCIPDDPSHTTLRHKCLCKNG